MYQLLIFLVFSSLLGSLECSKVELRPNPKRPTNPDVWLTTRRPETSYEGPLHHFESSMKLQDSVLKLVMPSGHKECFYYVLLDGYQLHLYITTTSSNEPTDVFDVYISTGDGDHIRDYIYQTTVSHHLNVTENDTYEVCVYVPMGGQTISFSSYYYLAPLFSKALEDLAHLNNISVLAENSVVNLEVSIGKALNDIRNQPHSFRDFFILQQINTYVQWRAILFISLMLISFLSTTVFIRRLFGSGSRSSV